MAFFQNPRLGRTFAPDADTGGDALPPVPVTRPSAGGQQAYQGARQFQGLSDAFHQNLATRRGPITPQTPTSELQRRASGIRYGFTPGNGNGASWQNSPDGMRTFHSEPTGFLRPPTGPESAAAVGMRTELKNLASPVAAPNLPVRPVLAMPGGVVRPTAAVPVSQPGAGAVTPVTGATAASPALQSPGIDSGTVVDGRRLNFGAMVDGVPTFSDGSGRLGIPRTVSADTIKAAEQGVNLVDHTNFQRPLAVAPGGGAPTTEQMVQQRMAQLTRPVTGSRPSEADFAASERNAIASGDWRSAAGTAANNLRMDAEYGGTPRLRRIAESQLAGLQSGAEQAASIALTGEQQRAIQAQQAEDDQALENTRGRNQLANTALEMTKQDPLQLIQAADGTYLGYDTRTNRAQPTVGADGKPVRGLATRDDAATKRTQEVQDQLTRNAAELAKNWQPPAGSPAGAQPPLAQFREQAAQLAGLEVRKDEKTGIRYVNINGQVVQL